MRKSLQRPWSLQERWQSGLLGWLTRVLGSLPLSWLHALGAMIAWLVIRLPVRENRVARRNLELCFPQLTPEQRAPLHRAALRSAAQGVLELPWLWTRPLAQVMSKVRDIEGEQELHAALAEQRGVLIAAPHMGSWELLNLWLSQHCRLAVLYRAPNSSVLDQWLNQGRTRAGASTVRAQSDQIRNLVRHLRGGGAIGILPDQQPKRGEGEFAAFFGIEALTMTLFPELVRRYHVPVVVAYAERLSQGRGWRLRLRRVEPAPAQVHALNQMIEAVARSLPEQYQWTYKRFSMRPEGQAKLY